jgi:hypothetical protein
MALPCHEATAAQRAAPPFVPRCTQRTFSEGAWRDLLEYGCRLEKLASGDRSPRTDKQAAFASHFAAPSEREPDCYFEKLWAKYLFRVEWEGDPSNWAAMGSLQTLLETGFGTREDTKRLHRNQPDWVYFNKPKRK